MAQDEFESGLRKILNFGHTIGHALEKILGYGKILHGEAVWLGMIAATKLSHNRGLLPKSDFDKIMNFFQATKFQHPASRIQHPAQIIAAIKNDKKTTNGKPNFILLTEIGKTIIVDDVSEEEIVSVLESL